ncbi:MAG: hypothetical protein U5L95_00115 [Candidatus Saccharibacteria bacterium]|nr:hypothetical protein [Candidatus Saccharibacteria bacterium]
MHDEIFLVPGLVGSPDCSKSLPEWARDERQRNKLLQTSQEKAELFAGMPEFDDHQLQAQLRGRLKHLEQKALENTKNAKLHRNFEHTQSLYVPTHLSKH